MANSLMVLFPYKYKGQWVFDDEATGLFREAFVAGTDKIMDIATQNIPNAEKGFKLIFGGVPFPGAEIKLEWRREEWGGNVYFCRQLGMEGWLCPSLFKYFTEAPEVIYAAALPKD